MLVQSSMTSLPWVGGFIIGAVMSMFALLTMLAVVYLLRKKATFSRYKLECMSSPICLYTCLYCRLSCRHFKTSQKRSASLTDTHTNNTHSNTPQPYNEAQLGQPEYSYATCASKSQVKDDVVDNAVLYSMCGDIQLQHNVAYSKLNKN